MFLHRDNGEESVDGYLSESNDGTQGGQPLLIGDQFVIERILLKRTFDGRYAVVSGRCRNRYRDRRVALFLLFNPRWTQQAEGAAFDKPEERSPPVGDGALDEVRASWCH